jgi:hypothetical protein
MSVEQEKGALWACLMQIRKTLEDQADAAIASSTVIDMIDQALEPWQCRGAYVGGYSRPNGEYGNVYRLPDGREIELRSGRRVAESAVS